MRLAFAILAAAGSVAAAKPLPDGLKVINRAGTLLVTKGALAVPLFDGDDKHVGRTFVDPTSVELSDDGKRIVMAVGGCLDEADTPIEVSLASIEARFENLLGMQLHLKKQYADAIVHFTAAAQTDPTTSVYATNLLSAQSMSRKLDAADNTLATYGPTNSPWFAWRLAVDPELAAVRDRPAAKALAAAKPTKLAGYNPETDVAVSPLGLVASAEWQAVGMSPGAETVVVFDLAHDRRLLELPLFDFGGPCVDKLPRDALPDTFTLCTKAVRARAADRLRIIKLVLGALGFETRKTTWLNAHDLQDQDHVTSPDHQTTVDFKDDGIAITHGKAIATHAFGDTPWQLGWAGSVIVIQHRIAYECGGADSVQSASDVFAVP